MTFIPLIIKPFNYRFYLQTEALGSRAGRIDRKPAPSPSGPASSSVNKGFSPGPVLARSSNALKPSFTPWDVTSTAVLGLRRIPNLESGEKAETSTQDILAPLCSDGSGRHCDSPAKSG